MAEPVWVSVMDLELGVLVVEVEDDPEGDFADGVAAGVAALLNVLHPVDNSHS